MKILLLTTHLEMGGIPIYVESLANGLKRIGHVPVIVSDQGWLERRLDQNQILHHRIPCRTSSELNPKLWLRAFPQLLRIARKEKPDIIHAHTRVAQVLGWALSHWTNTPYVTTCHGLYRYRLGRRFFRCWGRWVMAISGPSMDRLVMQYKLAPPHRVVLIRNGVEVDRFSSRPVPSEVERFRQLFGLRGSPVIGSIGRLSPVKGLDLLLQAAPALLKRFPHLQILLVGDGPAKADLIELAYRLGIQDHLIITHPMDDTRLALAAMDLFIAPAHREGFGLAIVEAMAAGVAVVASNAGGPAEIIEDGISGLLIPPRDSEAIEKAVTRLLGDPGQRERMAQEGRQRARSQFDMKRVVQEVEQVYARAVA